MKKFIIHMLPYVIAMIAFSGMKTIPVWAIGIIMMGMDVYSFTTTKIWWE